ncbi:hypothetical protein AGABI2DRAFT_229354 [Agaricus bisporus var. bisporus H97]|uniref:hypothetical protein n=1 Tax=Agaricus bisporus var. bisporus (strain H97 / ATCC MYA-4626 / FGSC 10389) TaxID=936046 RepID=UPI00029F53A2|nr:hypothetical protein AGABI2DRAFT_229354 [Agaricus bisporus var. bisporus H97]EKV42229.1 hypothetical protein AGABI2DRAFT_229354 [Agaricus bisporus var. bisporus H97]
MKKRLNDRNDRASKKWEVLTGWADDTIEEEGEDDDRLASDGDILGEVSCRRQWVPEKSGEIPYEQRWETDLAAFQPRIRSQFRQRAELHHDWVNDIALCNYNQTVVSASSDGTVKAWNPHSTHNLGPTQVGSHGDYVRCLAYCRGQNWVASGSFDRTVKLWDLNASPSKQPVVTLHPPDATAPKTSIYALACDPYGRTIASGSPERVVRMWDPRSGKRTGKLVGHTDNIRAILISEDAKYLLTGSADASIKLWSLSSQRCLHTFTHHTDSVWSLFSDHPSLEVFYSGDRSGLVCRVDVEDCSDVSEGECIVLCQDSTDPERSSASEGVNKIVVMDDNLLWTASNTSSVKRWHIPQRRAARVALAEFDGERAPSLRSLSSEHISTQPLLHQNQSQQYNFEQGDTLCGIPMDSLVKLVSPNDPFAPFPSSRSRDPEVATLYSAASIMSIPRAAAYAVRSSTTSQGIFGQQHHSQPTPPHLHPSSSGPLHASRTEDTFTSLNQNTNNTNNPFRASFEDRELAEDAVPLVSEPDVVIEGDHGLVRSLMLNDRMHVLTVDTSGEVMVWDIVRGVCKGVFGREEVSAVAAIAGGSIDGSREAGGEEREKEKSPRETLEAVRERIEGEAVIQAWCSTDTKAGVLVVHVSERCFEAEVYADEVGFPADRHFSEEFKLNIGKWVLRNLFIGFIKEVQRRKRRISDRSDVTNDGFFMPGRSGITMSRTPSPARTPPGHFAPLPLSPPLMSSHNRQLSSSSTTDSPKLPVSPLGGGEDVLARLPGFGRRRSSVDGSQDGGGGGGQQQQQQQNGDEGTSTAGSVAVSSTTTNAVGNNSKTSTTNKSESSSSSQAPFIAVGFMERLKIFGRSSAKRPTSGGGDGSSGGTGVVNSTGSGRKTAAQALISGILSPPTSSDGPIHLLPSNMILMISEEASPGYKMLYRGMAGNATGGDVQVLEEVMPMWLMEYLLLNRTYLGGPRPPVAKLSFVLLPWNKDADVEPLPELLNTQQSKLTASRQLRVWKIALHVQEKMEKLSKSTSASRAPSIGDDNIHSRNNSNNTQQSPNLTLTRIGEEYEILCNEMVLPLTMTLAAVRQFVWKQSSELVMHYRRKRI